MFTAQQIRNIEFATEKKGYCITDVDAFHKEIAGEYEALQQECAAMLSEKDKELAALKEKLATLQSEKDRQEEKMLVLADKLEEYRKDENIIRNALINAEKLKENLLSEARQTADILLKDAQQKADKIVDTANSQVVGEQEKFLRIQNEVVKFKNQIVQLYKEHITLISELPDEEDVVEVELDEKPSENIPAEPVLIDPVYADDIPDLDLDLEEEANVIEDEPETVPEEDPLVASIVSDLTSEIDDINNFFAAEPSAEPAEQTAEETKQEPETKSVFDRFDFDDKFGF